MKKLPISYRRLGVIQINSEIYATPLAFLPNFETGARDFSIGRWANYWKFGDPWSDSDMFYFLVDS